MAKNWRISSISGALLAVYFIPVWTMIAFRIMVSPVQGLYERPNISFALFASDHMHLAGMATVRLMLETPSALRRPDFTCGSVAATVSIV